MNKILNYLENQIKPLERRKEENSLSNYGEGSLYSLKDLKEQLAIHGVLNCKNNKWNDLTKQTPHCWETGNWDGKRSDYVITLNDKMEFNVAVAYEGTMDGSRFLDFYDKHDFEVENVSYWMEFPNMP